jgi:hypothetical protein
MKTAPRSDLSRGPRGSRDSRRKRAASGFAIGRMVPLAGAAVATKHAFSPVTSRPRATSSS